MMCHVLQRYPQYKKKCKFTNKCSSSIGNPITFDALSDFVSLSETSLKRAERYHKKQWPTNTLCCQDYQMYASLPMKLIDKFVWHKERLV